MTNSPNPNSESIVPRRRRLKRILLWGGMGCGVTLLAVGTTASWLIRYRLAPIISNVLEGILQRRVDVGPLKDLP